MANKLYDLAALPHPFTAQVLNTPGYRPEPTTGDHTGCGTLLYR